jgi:hypothetical protein
MMRVVCGAVIGSLTVRPLLDDGGVVGSWDLVAAVAAQRLLEWLRIRLDDAFIAGGGEDVRGIHGHLRLEVEAAVADEERA